MILGIDTSLGTAVAVIEPDGVVRAEADSPDARGHAEAIGVLIEKALTDAGVSPAQIEHVAVGMGPGPFTGLRVGIAAARTFALGRGIPVIPVASHDAVALGVLMGVMLQEDGRLSDAPERFAVVTDARRREFAYSVYEGLDDDGLPVRTVGPALAPRDDLDAVLADLGARRGEAASVPAALLALAASRAEQAGRRIAGVDPLYLRAPDVTMPTEPRRVRS